MVIINDKHSMENVIKCLNEWTEAYDKGQPIVSDKEWDDLYFELKEAEERLGIILPDSPTQKVVYIVVNELKKVSHDEDYPMLSLDKTKSIADIEDKFANKNWIAMPKCDGLSCRLIYQNGRLLQASTRGNGEVGEDITHNARVVANIPNLIPHDGRLVVDGEIVCLDKDFESFANEYANSRNFAAGSIRLLDSAESAKRKLSFFAWDCIYDDESESSYLSAQLEDLNLYGFKTVSYSCQGSQSIEEAIETLKWDSERMGLPIDGVVFKLNNKSEYYAAGVTSHHPSGAYAFKFYDEEYETELLDIQYTMGRTGILTPVAIYKDVEIDGTTCNRASLHNISIMRELFHGTPFRGQKIKIFKSNMIIPQVSSSEDLSDFMHYPELPFCEIPAICPVCGAPTEIIESDSGTIELYCSNDTCEGKLINRLEHFVSKKGLDIKGLSKATLGKLIEWGWVSCVSDIFKLGQVSDLWANKPGFGAKSVDNLLNAIYEARTTTLEAYISAWGIPRIGRTYSRKLADTFETYEEFRNAVTDNFDFESIDGIGPEKADAIWSFDYTEMDSLVERGIITFKTEAPLENSGNALEGKTFCVTGKLKNFKNRDELKALIEAAGGKMTTSVSSKTNYLVNNDINSTSSKNVTAKNLGIPIITEQEIINMLSN